VLDLVGGALGDRDTAHAHLDRCDECRAVVGRVLRGDDADPTLTDLGSVDPGLPCREFAELVRVQRGDDPDRTAPGRPAIARSVVSVMRPLLRPLLGQAERGAPPTAPNVTIPTIRTIRTIDEFRIVERLGSGGMGTVYRARDTLLERDVALKTIAASSSDAARQRFLVEARAVARIRHPNVVVVHRVVAADEPYIVYALVRGHTFAELATPMPWPKALELATGVARGLTAAHACNVLHRDLKPANLMIDDEGDVVLVDFGLAKLDGEDALPGFVAGSPDPAITASGVALGTPRYMAPEAWRGAPATAQTDLYSLGVVLFELLTGTLPFADVPLAELGRAVTEDDPPGVARFAPWVPPLLAALADRCLARDPAARPASAAAVADELEGLQRGRAFEAFERDRVSRAPVGNPYPGARPFGFEHQGVLFGRRDELRALVEQLRTRPLVVVTGEAGTGKTSLCTAGLLPLVSRGALGGARKWVAVPLEPGPRPLAALAEALDGHVDVSRAELERALVSDPAAIVEGFRAGHRGGCTAHVLFVDHLEQLVAPGTDPEEARQFAALLGALAEPAAACRVLAALRYTDLLAVAQLPGLAAAIGPALYLLLEPRGEAALREIIVEPARLGGRTVAEPVVESLVAASARGELRLAELASRLASLWDAG